MTTEDKIKKARTAITISPELLERVKVMAKKREQSVSQVIALALQTFIKDVEG